jgi:hypothetical protein
VYCDIHKNSYNTTNTSYFPTTILLYVPLTFLEQCQQVSFFHFTYMCTQYLNCIHPWTFFPYLLLPPTGINSLRQDLFCFWSYFVKQEKKKKKKIDIFLCLRYICREFPFYISMYICIITKIGLSPFFFILPQFSFLE